MTVNAVKALAVQLIEDALRPGAWILVPPVRLRHIITQKICHATHLSGPDNKRVPNTVKIKEFYKHVSVELFEPADQ